MSSATVSLPNNYSGRSRRSCWHSPGAGWTRGVVVAGCTAGLWSCWTATRPCVRGPGTRAQQGWVDPIHRRHSSCTTCRRGLLPLHPHHQLRGDIWGRCHPHATRHRRRPRLRPALGCRPSLPWWASCHHPHHQHPTTISAEHQAAAAAAAAAAEVEVVEEQGGVVVMVERGFAVAASAATEERCIIMGLCHRWRRG